MDMSVTDELESINASSSTTLTTTAVPPPPIVGADEERQLPKCGGKISEEEKIFVTVRLRPLNEREATRNDFSAWECCNDNTISYAYANERSYPPQSFTFDRVFAAETTNREVYEKGAKDVALSAMAGKNATIFAYGQTSSGKTYTMQGITESAADDIFSSIHQNDDRAYLLKFSALEIYNEVATDLLNPESGPLRLLDDPERGTVVEKLEEKIVEDRDHLQSFLALCDAHRQIGETSLNERSSRSHLIIRLSIESSPRVTAEDTPSKSLIAILNFVDLAGSERVSLTHSDGSRLKEGCYINRSLLTLSTVIRKLSESSRTKIGHVPYRDSKLTRILQNSLGGNARTAIICTISASNRHVEQTKNTLFFASCAKEVTNRAHVNMVISDKELIKQLKREVALLEAKLRLTAHSTRGEAFSSSSSSSSSDALMVEKDEQIQKMQDEMRQALQQRDHAQSQLDGVLKQMEASEQARALILSRICGDDASLSRSYYCEVEANGLATAQPQEGLPYMWGSGGHTVNHSQPQLDANPAETAVETGTPKSGVVPKAAIMNQNHGMVSRSASAILLQEIYKLEHLQHELTQDANRALQAAQREVERLRLHQPPPPSIPSSAATNHNNNIDGCGGGNAAVLNYKDAVVESVAKLQAEMNEIYESRLTLSLATTTTTTDRSCSSSSSSVVDHGHGQQQQQQSVLEGGTGGGCRRGGVSLKDAFMHRNSSSSTDYYSPNETITSSSATDRFPYSVDFDKALANMRVSVEQLGMPPNTYNNNYKQQQLTGAAASPSTAPPLSHNGNGTCCSSSGASSYSVRSSVDHASNCVNQLALVGTPSRANLSLSSPSTSDGKTGGTPAGPSAAAVEENIRGVYAYVTDLKERVAKLQYQKQLLASRVLELERNEVMDDDGSSSSVDCMVSPDKWKSDLQLKRKQIFELWSLCHVSVIHRSQFYLLFRGEPADSMYIEVELRRLLWLRDFHYRNAKPDGAAAAAAANVASPGTSMRRLKREREWLVKRLRSRMSAAEREAAYRQWGIPLKSKQRKMRLAHAVWTNPHSEEHMRMSAELVGRLVGLWDDVVDVTTTSGGGGGGGYYCKEMFQLTFSPPTERPPPPPLLHNHHHLHLRQQQQQQQQRHINYLTPSSSSSSPLPRPLLPSTTWFASSPARCRPDPSEF